MWTIAFDVMGNDNGVRAGVEAAVDFVDKNLNYNVIIVGDAKQINVYLKETERIRIIDVPKVVDKDVSIRQVRNDQTSMAQAINLVKDKKAHAVISSGNSGVYLAMATLILKRIPGVKRPAFMPVFPTIIRGQRFVLLDAGANLDTTAQMLVQWAHLGSVFAKEILGNKEAKVGIVNIGTEATKGKEFHKLAHQQISESNLNYIGFIEPRNLLDGQVDVAVVDGYAGNMILKSMEGAVLSLLKLIKTEITAKTKYKVGALMAKGAFKNAKETLDYRNVGAAWLIGLNGLAIKCHGGADKKSYLGAFAQVKEGIEKNALDKFSKVVVSEN